MTAQESNHVPESMAQTLSKFWKARGCDRSPGKPLPVPSQPQGEEPKPNLNLPWHSFTALYNFFTRSYFTVSPLAC